MLINGLPQATEAIGPFAQHNVTTGITEQVSDALMRARYGGGAVQNIMAYTVARSADDPASGFVHIDVQTNVNVKIHNGSSVALHEQLPFVKAGGVFNIYSKYATNTYVRGTVVADAVLTGDVWSFSLTNWIVAGYTEVTEENQEACVEFKSPAGSGSGGITNITDANDVSFDKVILNDGKVLKYDHASKTFLPASQESSGVSSNFEEYYNAGGNVGSYTSDDTYIANTNQLTKAVNGDLTQDKPTVNSTAYRNLNTNPIKAILPNTKLHYLSFTCCGARTFGSSVGDAENLHFDVDIWEYPSDPDVSVPISLGTVQIPVNEASAANVKANQIDGGYCYGEVALTTPLDIESGKLYGLTVGKTPGYDADNDQVASVTNLILVAEYSAEVV